MRYWLICTLLAFASTAGAEEPTRTWTSGGFSVEATFVKFEDGKVELDTGSKIVSILEAKLGKADQDYLADLRDRRLRDQQTAQESLPTDFDWNFSSTDALAALKTYGAVTKELDESHTQDLKRFTKQQERERNSLDAKHEQQRRRNLRDAVVALEKSAAKERKESNNAEATRIQKGIAKLKQEFSKPATTHGSNADPDWPTQLGDLTGTWKWGARGMKDRVTFFEDGTATATWGGEGTWEKMEHRIVVLWLNNKTGFGSPKWDTINLPLDLQNVTGDSWVGPNMLRAEKIDR